MSSSPESDPVAEVRDGPGDPSVDPQSGETASSEDRSRGMGEVFEQVSFGFFQSNLCLPVEFAEGVLKVGVPEEGYDPQIMDNLRLQLDCPVEPVRMDEDEITQTLRQLESEVIANREGGLDSLSEETLESFRSQVIDSRQQLDSSEEQPIASRVNSIIADAVLNQVSDIHFEPRESSISVRFRRDGMLFDYEQLPKDILPGIVSRIKVMADMDIAEQLRPQDGRMNLNVGNKEIDVRVSIVPTVHGERAVLRVLDRETLKNSLAELGLREGDREAVEDLLAQSDGIVLVTGPTGSGKTTSLYCFLQEIKRDEENIMTLEDPVEYQLPGINQMEIRPERDVTFASGLRSVLRQDPDVIMVGEIRDRESAELAVHASLTGHLVFSTLHTRRSVGALSRLLNLGLDPHLIGAGLSGIIAQRLVRTLCSACKRPAEVGYRANGCEECRQSGYAGRTGVFEILRMDEGVRELLEAGEGEQAISDHLEERGFRTLRERGRTLVEEGITSLEELQRVVNT